MNYDKITNILNEFAAHRFNYDIWIVANVSDTVQDEETFIQHASFSEFFTKAEFASISSSIIELFGYVRIFYSEMEFINHVIFNKESLDTNRILIFNFSRDGIQEGKKSLVPSFCDLFGLMYVSSNAFVISLLRNKYVYTQYLKSLGISVPITLRYYLDEIFDNNSLNNKQIIVKNVCESASIGMDEKSVFKLSDSTELNNKLEERCKTLGVSELLVQEYIPGKECEVFVVREGNTFYAFPPIMLNINNSKIITSAISDTYDYSFSPLTTNFSGEICSKIRLSSEKSAKLLGISNYARFDYRIKENGDFYLIDIAGSPYLTRHSSVEYLFTNILNLQYSDIFLLIAAITIKNYSHDVNCKSDNNNPLEV